MNGYKITINPSWPPVPPYFLDAQIQVVLRSNLHQEQVIPEGGTAVAVTYCGACGWTLACAPASTRGPMQFQPVAAPADKRTPEGQFQLRCRELIGEIRSLGFEPNVWVAMINDLGAAAAARKLLADHHQLAVTLSHTPTHLHNPPSLSPLTTPPSPTPRERCPGGTGSAHCAGARYGGVGGERHLDQGQRRDRPAAYADRSPRVRSAGSMLTVNGRQAVNALGVSAART